MKLLILFFILLVTTASGQLYSRLNKQYYSPLSESSSILKKIPKIIKEEIVFKGEKTPKGIDTLQNKWTTVIEYNKDNHISIARSFLNNVETSETEFILLGNLYGLSTREYIIRNKKRELSQETQSTKLSNKTYVNTHLWHGFTTANKPDTTLSTLTTFFYFNDWEKELITETCLYIHVEDVTNNWQEINQYDYQGNLITKVRPSDSSFATYYYPLPAFYKSKNTQLSLPDSVILYVQTKGKVRYYATIYNRNKYKDAVKIVNYSWEYGQPHTLENETNNVFEYDQYGNWTKWEMVRKNANETSNFNTKSITTRSFTY